MLLDDRLIRDAQAAGRVTAELNRRMLDLIAYAVTTGSEAVLLGCSMYGGAVETARLEHGVPVLGSDEALFAEISRGGFEAPLLLGPLPQAVDDSVDRLREALREDGSTSKVVGRAVEGAAATVAAGDPGRLHDLLLDAIRPHLGTVDAVALGNFSISPARERLQAELDIPVLSPTELAAERLRQQLIPSRRDQ
jgi:Asp/Glu/hydantoin racemase